MRIMQIGNSHYDYLKVLSRRFKKFSSHAQCMQAYVDDYYWCCHTLTPVLQRMGHDVFLCVPTDLASQELWCREHGVNATDNVLALLAQVEWFRPDVLYVGSPSTFHDTILDHLTFRPKVIVGWHATITRPHMLFHNYDLMLSSHEECLLMARENGARHTAVAYPGMPSELRHAYATDVRNKRSDMCFSGYWAVSHPRRNRFLHELADRLPEMALRASRPVDCAYHLGFYDDGPHCPDAVRRIDRGAVWGQSMFRAFARSRIVLNGYASINFGPQNLSPNMRQLEALGVGSFLLTERSDNLAAFFTEDVDMVTYASSDELVDKALFYLEHEAERERIAGRGQETCYRFYSLDIRVKAFLDAVQRVLDAAACRAPEVLVREVRALIEARAQDTPVSLDEGAERLVTEALEVVRERLLADDRAQGLPLLKAVELALAGTLQDPQAVGDRQQLNLCRALRSAARGEIAQAQRQLRCELEHWPHNDLARHCLSRLVLGKAAIAG